MTDACVTVKIPNVASSSQRLSSPLCAVEFRGLTHSTVEACANVWMCHFYRLKSIRHSKWKHPMYVMQSSKMGLCRGELLVLKCAPLFVYCSVVFDFYLFIYVFIYLFVCLFVCLSITFSE